MAATWPSPSRTVQRPSFSGRWGIAWSSFLVLSVVQGTLQVETSSSSSFSINSPRKGDGIQVRLPEDVAEQMNWRRQQQQQQNAADRMRLHEAMLGFPAAAAPAADSEHFVPETASAPATTISTSTEGQSAHRDNDRRQQQQQQQQNQHPQNQHPQQTRRQPPLESTSPTADPNPPTSSVPDPPSVPALDAADDAGDGKRGSWGWLSVAWKTHVYVSGTLFVLLAIHCFANLIRLLLCHSGLGRGRGSAAALESACSVSARQCFVAINCCLVVMGVVRSTWLLHDPYNAALTWPRPLAYLLVDTGLPCMTTAFAALFLALLRATTVELVSPGFQTPTALGILCGIHFALSVAVDITVGLVFSLRYLVLIQQGVFIVWSLLLSAGYFYIFSALNKVAARRQGALVRSAYPKLVLESTSATTTATGDSFRAGGDGGGGHSALMHHHRSVASSSASSALKRSPLTRAVHLTLGVAVLSSLLGGVQLFAMIKMLGLLKEDMSPHQNEWAWYGYQVSMRILEVTICVLLAVIGTSPFRIENEDQEAAAAAEAEARLAGIAGHEAGHLHHQYMNGAAAARPGVIHQFRLDDINRGGGGNEGLLDPDSGDLAAANLKGFDRDSKTWKRKRGQGGRLDKKAHGWLCRIVACCPGCNGCGDPNLDWRGRADMEEDNVDDDDNEIYSEICSNNRSVRQVLQVAAAAHHPDDPLSAGVVVNGPFGPGGSATLGRLGRFTSPGLGQIDLVSLGLGGPNYPNHHHHHLQMRNLGGGASPAASAVIGSSSTLVMPHNHRRAASGSVMGVFQPNNQTATLLRSNYHDVIPASSSLFAQVQRPGGQLPGVVVGNYSMNLSASASGADSGASSRATLDAAAAAIYSNLRGATATAANLEGLNGGVVSRPSSMLCHDSGFVRFRMGANDDSAAGAKEPPPPSSTPKSHSAEADGGDQKPAVNAATKGTVGRRLGAGHKASKKDRDGILRASQSFDDSVLLVDTSETGGTMEDGGGKLTSPSSLKEVAGSIPGAKSPPGQSKTHGGQAAGDTGSVLCGGAGADDKSVPAEAIYEPPPYQRKGPQQQRQLRDADNSSPPPSESDETTGYGGKSSIYSGRAPSQCSSVSATQSFDMRMYGRSKLMQQPGGDSSLSASAAAGSTSAAQPQQQGKLDNPYYYYGSTRNQKNLNNQKPRPLLPSQRQALELQTRIGRAAPGTSQQQQLLQQQQQQQQQQQPEAGSRPCSRQALLSSTTVGGAAAEQPLTTRVGPMSAGLSQDPGGLPVLGSAIPPAVFQRSRSLGHHYATRDLPPPPNPQTAAAAVAAATAAVAPPAPLQPPLLRQQLQPGSMTPLSYSRWQHEQQQQRQLQGPQRHQQPPISRRYNFQLYDTPPVARRPIVPTTGDGGAFQDVEDVAADYQQQLEQLQMELMLHQQQQQQQQQQHLELMGMQPEGMFLAASNQEQLLMPEIRHVMGGSGGGGAGQGNYGMGGILQPVVVAASTAAAAPRPAQLQRDFLAAGYFGGNGGHLNHHRLVDPLSPILTDQEMSPMHHYHPHHRKQSEDQLKHHHRRRHHHHHDQHVDQEVDTERMASVADFLTTSEDNLSSSSSEESISRSSDDCGRSRSRSSISSSSSRSSSGDLNGARENEDAVSAAEGLADNEYEVSEMEASSYSHQPQGGHRSGSAAAKAAFNPGKKVVVSPLEYSAMLKLYGSGTDVLAAEGEGASEEAPLASKQGRRREGCADDEGLDDKDDEDDDDDDLDYGGGGLADVETDYDEDRGRHRRVANGDRRGGGPLKSQTSFSKKSNIPRPVAVAAALSKAGSGDAPEGGACQGSSSNGKNLSREK